MRKNLNVTNSFQIVIGLFLYLFFGLLPVHAAQTQSTGISVSPSIIRLDLQQDKPQAELTYANTSNQTLEVSLSAQNFTELEEGYKLSFLEGKKATNYAYGLSSWIEYNKKTLIIEPHTAEKVTVFINVKELTPGGHYASILAQVNAKNVNSGSIGLNATLASLIFVRTNTGREIEKATVPFFSTIQDGIFFPMPRTAFFRLQNTGDTDLVPYGTVIITDMNGHVVQKGIINEDSSTTLPESIRRYDVSLHNATSFFFPQIYTATLTLSAGKSPVKISLTRTFFSQGTIPFIQVILVGIIALAVYVFVKKRKGATTQS